MLNDQSYLNYYIQENQKRLNESYNELTFGLKNLSIPYIPASAGIFCVIDLRFLLKGNTWSAEDDLQVELVKLGIVFTPGKSFHFPEPGYFRICFAWVPKYSIYELIRRLSVLIDSRKSFLN